MTIKASTHPTLLDVANLNQMDGTIAQVVEILNQQNEMLMDMVMMESNEPLSHRHTIRTGLPSGVWRGYNQGVPPSKSTTVTVVDTIGNYELYAEVDKDLADLNGNSAAWRLQEEQPFMEKTSQVMQKQLVYGDEATEPNGFTGFMPRYATKTATTAQSADNVIDAGGTGGDNASILLVAWDPSTVFGLYPKGSEAGFKIEDKGMITIEDADGSGGRMEAYRTHYKWQLGLTVKDWRYVVRIVNIDKSDLAADASAGAKLTENMFEAINLLPTMKGRMAFYMARDVRTKLFQQLASAVKQSTLTVQMVGGVMEHFFHGIPIRRVDPMAADEARIT